MKKIIKFLGIITILILSIIITLPKSKSIEVIALKEDIKEENHINENYNNVEYEKKENNEENIEDKNNKNENSETESIKNNEENNDKIENEENNIEENNIEENNIEEKSIEEKSIEEKSIEENSIEENSIEEKSIEENSIEENSIEENSIEENSIEENIIDEKGTRGNPAKINETVIFNGMNTYVDKFILKITLKEINRGAICDEISKSANEFNEPPKEGKEYLFLKFKIEGIDSENNKQINLSTYNFDIFSEIGEKYNEFVAISGLDPTINPMYKNDIQEGYATFMIDKYDENPKIVFLERDNGGIWFNINN